MNSNGPSWFAKLWYVTHRSYLSIVRDSSVQNMRIIQKLVRQVVNSDILNFTH